jgi:SAM-dependent methyltransferase
MERVVYEKMAELDQQHWWYRARRQVLAALIRRKARPPAGGRLLEIGCGTGHNLEMLSEFGQLDALELDDTARAVAEKRLGRPVMDSPLPELRGVPQRAYDLVAALDVIEHIDDDDASLDSIATLLKPGGKLVMTVPAHEWMWSAHDVVSHHKRRYSKRSLKRLIHGSPLRLDSMGYLNSLLLPAAIAERLASKARGKQDADLWLPPRPINATLETLFASERHLIGRVPLPPGLSLFAIASA